MSAASTITLVGRIGSIEDNNGVAIASLATSQSWKNEGDTDWKERTEWHRIVRFGKAAEDILNGKYVKGDKVQVVGQTRTNEYQGQDGKKKYSTEIIADSIRKVRGEKGGTFSAITLVGTVGKVLPKENFTGFTLATTDSWLKEGQWHERTDWHRISTWDNQAVKAAKLVPGDEVALVGEQRYRKYNDGNGDVYITEIHPLTFTKIASKKADGVGKPPYQAPDNTTPDPAPAPSSTPAQAPADAFNDFDDDEPF